MKLEITISEQQIKHLLLNKILYNIPVNQEIMDESKVQLIYKDGIFTAKVEIDI